MLSNGFNNNASYNPFGNSGTANNNNAASVFGKVVKSIGGFFGRGQQVQGYSKYKPNMIIN